MKIALVIPYFGKLPAYFNFFLRSLEGKHLDVLFFSDLVVEKYPENFRPFRMTFDAFRKLASQKLGVDVRIESARRLCDLKPMYGKIFEDHLSDYVWWAFGDCDLVYGSSFNEVLDTVLASDADVFSLERQFCCGPLCFVRNTREDNLLFKKARGWEAAATSSSRINIGFDELGGDWFDELRAGKMSLEDCAARASSFSEAVLLSGDVKFAYREVMEQSDLAHGELVVSGSAGDLSLNGSPIHVYHYVRPKQRKYFTFVWASYERAQDFMIDSAGFYVTPCQKACRRGVGMFRKFRAALRSLRVNGLARLLPGWRTRFHAG